MNRGRFGFRRVTNIGPLVNKQIFREPCFLTDEGESELRDLRRLILNTDISKDELIIQASEGNLVLIGEGSDRIVFHQLGTKCIAKVSKSEDPVPNELEARGYSKIDDEVVAKYFNPVLDFTTDFGIIVQRRVDEVGIPDSELIRLVDKIIIEHGYTIHDYFRDNFGIVDGEPVVIDYGQGVTKVSNTDFKSRQELFNKVKRDIQETKA